MNAGTNRTSPRRLRKLLAMTPAEIAHRGRQALWQIADRLLEGPVTRRVRTAPQGAPVARSPAPGLDDPGAVAAYVRARHGPEAEHLVATADALMAGRFPILGWGSIALGVTPRWHEEPVAGRTAGRRHWSRIDLLNAAEVGDSKVVWELNRHQFLATLGQAYRLTGDARYAERAWALVDSWIGDNPPGQGINWVSSLEVALRSIAWTWAWHLADGPGCLGPAARHRFLTALERHGRHVEKYLSRYFSPNTHLTGEALGLCYLATAWPSLPRSPRWWRLGSEILTREAETQVRSDGVHFERSACYHLYTLDFLLHYVLLCQERSSLPAATVVDTVRRLADAAQVLKRPDGLLPNVGDEDGGRLLFLGRSAPLDPAPSLAVAAAVLATPAWSPLTNRGAEAVWLLGVDRFEAAAGAAAASPAPEPPERLYPLLSSGLVVSRAGRDDYAVVSAGLQEPRPRCLGHIHDDALALELWCRSRPVLVDPGTLTYTGDAARRRWYRSAAAHSTARVDSRPDAPGAAPFEWPGLTGGRILHHDSGPGHHTIELVRELHLAGERVLHRRRFVARHGVGWLLWDRFHGSGKHLVELRFQLPPGTSPVERADGWIRLSSADLLVVPGGDSAWSARLVESPVSPRYGRSEPALALILSARTALPTDVVTLVLPPVAGDPPRIAEQAVPAGDSRHGFRRILRADEPNGVAHNIVLREWEPMTVADPMTASPSTVWLGGRSDAVAEHLIAP